jgi:SiaC family regulatory phosphoprotein
MTNLEIKKGDYTPEVEMRIGFISMEGNSYPSNTEKFYKPIINWLKDYIKTFPEYTEVHLKFEHMDSPTVKSIYEIIKILKPSEKGKLTNTEVFWYYDLQDDETLDKGRLISDHLKMNFTFIPY